MDDPWHVCNVYESKLAPNANGNSGGAWDVHYYMEYVNGNVNSQNEYILATGGTGNYIVAFKRDPPDDEYCPEYYDSLQDSSGTYCEITYAGSNRSQMCHAR